MSLSKLRHLITSLEDQMVEQNVDEMLEQTIEELVEHTPDQIVDQQNSHTNSPKIRNEYYYS